MFEKNLHKPLVKLIPEYRAYGKVEDRLDTDKSIRNFLYSKMLELADHFTNTTTLLLQRQILELWRYSNDIKSWIGKINKFLTAKNNDIYRHTTFFITPDVSEWIDIPVIYKLETDIILLTDSLNSNIEKLNLDLDGVISGEEAPDSVMSKLSKSIASIYQDVKKLHKLISDRAELISSFEIVAF